MERQAEELMERQSERTSNYPEVQVRLRLPLKDAYLIARSTDGELRRAERLVAMTGKAKPWAGSSAGFG